MHFPQIKLTQEWESSQLEEALRRQDRGTTPCGHPWPRAGVRAPAAGRSHPPPPRQNKGKEKGSKQPSACQALTHPWSAGRRWEAGKASSAQGARAAAGGRPEGGSPGAPGRSSSQRPWCHVGGRQALAGTLTPQVVWTGVPGGRLSALSQASSFLLSRSESSISGDTPVSEHTGRHKCPRRLTGEAVTQDGAEGSLHRMAGWRWSASVCSAPTFVCFIWQRQRGAQHRGPTEGFFLWPCRLSEPTPRLE